jgi:GH18 family chitinase
MYFSEWRKQQRLKETYNFFKVPANKITDVQFATIIHAFIKFAKKYLKIKSNPKIKFVKDSKFAQKIGAFGQITGKNEIKIDILNRHPMDILRTVAHELVHLQQHETGIKGSGHAGSETENKANLIAGKMLREFGSSHSELFEFPSIGEEKKKRKKTLEINNDEHYPTELF